MNEQAEIYWGGKKALLPFISGTTGERAIDISKLREQTGLITLDPGYGNTGSCQSAITFIDGSRFIEAAKDKKNGHPLMGFGHRVYKNYDPRAKIIKDQCHKLLGALNISDPLLDIALQLEEAARHDPYFVERKCAAKWSGHESQNRMGSAAVPSPPTPESCLILPFRAMRNYSSD